MTLVFLPTVNSYRRFAPGTFAPPGLTWGYENRTTCLRVVGHDARALRVENRLPGADTNPYLTVAATLAAGVAGILGRSSPTPVKGNGYAQAARRAILPAPCPRPSPRLGLGLRPRLAGRRFRRGLCQQRESQFDQFRRQGAGCRTACASSIWDSMMDLRSRFLEGMSRAATFVAVVTTDGPGGRDGVTVSSLSLGFRRWRGTGASGLHPPPEPGGGGDSEERGLLRQSPAPITPASRSASSCPGRPAIWRTC
jgi:hypothetical protein